MKDGKLIVWLIILSMIATSIPLIFLIFPFQRNQKLDFKNQQKAIVFSQLDVQMIQNETSSGAIVELERVNGFNLTTKEEYPRMLYAVKMKFTPTRTAKLILDTCML